MRAAQYLSNTSLLAEQTGRVVRTLGKDGEEADGGWIDSEQTVYPLPENYSSNRLPPSPLYYAMKMGTATSRNVSHRHDQPYKCDKLYKLYRHGFASQKLLVCCDNLSVCTITISADQNSPTVRLPAIIQIPHTEMDARSTIFQVVWINTFYYKPNISVIG